MTLLPPASQAYRSPIRTLLALVLFVVPACLCVVMGGLVALAFFTAGAGGAVAAIGVLAEIAAETAPEGDGADAPSGPVQVRRGLPHRSLH